jgi:hypothetical protein
MYSTLKRRLTDKNKKERDTQKVLFEKNEKKLIEQ